MKKILLFLFGLTIFAAQSQFEIRRAGETVDLSGETLTYNITLNDVPTDDEYAFYEGMKVYVYNTSSEDRNLVVKRELINVPTDWRDNLCWPPTCYNITQGTESYTTPHSAINPSPLVVAGATQGTEIKPQFFPRVPGSTAKYRYTLVDPITLEEFSFVEVNVNYVNNVSISSAKVIELSMVPNPATDAVTINAEGLVNASLRVVDMLGNVVYSGEFSNSKKLNISEFKNGVYFVTVQGDSTKGFTKKLVVRH